LVLSETFPIAKILAPSLLTSGINSILLLFMGFETPFIGRRSLVEKANGNLFCFQFVVYHIWLAFFEG